MRKVTTLCPLALVLCWSPLASAQLPPIERLEGGSISEDGTGLYDPNTYVDEGNPYAPASDGDDDLGEQIILQRQPKRAPVRARADTFLFWSDNVASVNKNEEDGWFYGGSVSLRWKQRLTRHVSFDTYAYQDAYFYDQSKLDFQSSEFGAGLVGSIPWEPIRDVTFYARYEFLYVHAENPLFGVLAGANEHVDSRYHRIRVGSYRALYSRPSHLVSLSTNTRWDFDSSSGAPRRYQSSGRLSYTWAATGRLRLTTYYRLSHRNYINSGRRDWNHYFGLEANYQLNDWAQLYASILYGVNESNVSGRDYDAFQGGIGAGFRASF